MSVRLSVIDSAPNIGAIDPELVERFRADYISLRETEGKFGIAVSGGPDSLALLLLAHHAFRGEIEAATVDHGLRHESVDEAKHVAQICEQLGVVHAVLPVTVRPGNLQAEARTARYSALARWHDDRGLAALTTAHHADDQAETLLMRLNRSSGLPGLAGVRAQSWFFLDDPPGEYEIVRPLLGWRKRELEQLVEAAGIEALHDPSNQSDDFDRVRIRKALADQDWLDPLALAKSARLLGEAWKDVEWEAEVKRNDWLIKQDDGFVLLWGHGRIFEIEMVMWIIKNLDGKATRSEASRMIDQLYARHNASLGGVLARPTMYQTRANSTATAWKFEREPPRRTN